MDKWIDEWMDGCTDRGETDIHAKRQIDRLTDRQAEKQTDSIFIDNIYFKLFLHYCVMRQLNNNQYWLIVYKSV